MSSHKSASLSNHGMPWGLAPIHVLKELEHQARVNICTWTISAIFNEVCRVQNCIDSCKSFIRSVIKNAKNQVA